MSIIKRLILVLILIPLSSNLFSQEIPKIRSLEKEGGDWESWLKIIPVSGDIKVGLTNTSKNKQISSPKSFYTYIPEDSDSIST